MGQSVWLTPGGGALGGPCLRRGTEGGRGAALGLTASAPQMPVCSYFLKGVCSNSNCPYSHVYVSRKAEVCTDFLRGYCPLGAKVRGLGWGAPGPGPPCLGGLSSPPALAPLLRGRPHPPWAAGPGARGGASSPAQGPQHASLPPGPQATGARE